MMALEQHSATAAHWPRTQYDALFLNTGDQISERMAWVAEDENSHREDKLPSPQFIAFLVARRIAAEWELENIVVAESMRRHRTGSLLVNRLIAHARTAGGTAIFLEVRQSNESARALYQNSGFQPAGLRKGYYSNPTEDALLLRLALM